RRNIHKTFQEKGIRRYNKYELKNESCFRHCATHHMIHLHTPQQPPDWLRSLNIYNISGFISEFIGKVTTIIIRTLMHRKHFHGLNAEIQQNWLGLRRLEVKNIILLLHTTQILNLYFTAPKC
ncbi:hypothetical protein ACJX0J_017695, partial [Zea mays]